MKIKSIILSLLGVFSIASVIALMVMRKKVSN